MSIICSHPESQKKLQQIDCFSTLADILCDEMALEWTRTEAAGCLGKNEFIFTGAIFNFNCKFFSNQHIRIFFLNNSTRALYPKSLR